MTDRQTSIALMSETMLDRCLELSTAERLGDAAAILSEWVVDGVDPDDGEYQFTFINDLTEIA